MKSQDHKDIINQLLTQNLAAFTAVQPAAAKAILDHDMGTTWRQSIKSSNWKRESKTSDKHSDPSTGRKWTTVSRRFKNSYTGSEIIIREETEGASTRLVINLLLGTFVPEIRRLLEWQDGSTGDLTTDANGKPKLRHADHDVVTKDISPVPRESILDTPKPAGFGDFA